MQHPYINAIDIKQKSFSIFDLYQLYKKGNLQLDTTVTRRPYFELEDSSHVIESLFLGIPINNIYLIYDSSNRSYKVLDGNKRLISIFNYIDNEFSLEGLNFLTQLNNYYKRIDPFYQDIIRTTCLSCIIIIDTHTPTTEKLIEILKSKIFNVVYSF